MPVPRSAISSPALRAGFSLIEIILALGIISFALVGILGLFPVAVSAAANSQHETQAALIARSIFEQLEATPGTPLRSVNLSERFDEESSRALQVDLSKANTIPPIGFDASGKPLASSNDANTAYQAEISIRPVTATDHGLSDVVVQIKPLSSKTISYPFASQLRQQ